MGRGRKKPALLTYCHLPLSVHCVVVGAVLLLFPTGKYSEQVHVLCTLHLNTEYWIYLITTEGVPRY